MAVVGAPKELVDRLRESRSVTEQEAFEAVEKFVSNLERSCSLRKDQALTALDIIYRHGNGSDKVHTLALELDKGYLDADKIKRCIMRTERDAFPLRQSSLPLHRFVPKQSYFRPYSSSPQVSTGGNSIQSRERDNIGFLLNANGIKKRPEDIIIPMPRAEKSMLQTAERKSNRRGGRLKIPTERMPEVLARLENGEKASKLATEFKMAEGSFYNAIAKARKNDIKPDHKFLLQRAKEQMHAELRAKPEQATTVTPVINPVVINRYLDKVDKKLANQLSVAYRISLDVAKAVLASYVVKATVPDALAATHFDEALIRKIYARLAFLGVKQHDLVFTGTQAQKPAPIQSASTKPLPARKTETEPAFQSQADGLAAETGISKSKLLKMIKYYVEGGNNLYKYGMDLGIPEKNSLRASTLIKESVSRPAQLRNAQEETGAQPIVRRDIKPTRSQVEELKREYSIKGVDHEAALRYYLSGGNNPYEMQGIAKMPSDSVSFAVFGYMEQRFPRTKSAANTASTPTKRSYLTQKNLNSLRR